MILTVFVATLAAIAADTPESGQPILYRQVPVPLPLLSRDGYPGDIRIGDLNGDGRIECVSFRSIDDGMKPCFLGAFDLQGKVLWQGGSDGEQPARPGSVTVYDLDGDGTDEIICFFLDRSIEAPARSLANVTIQIRDGETGKILRQAAPAKVREMEGDGPNWVHQRILVANFRGTDSPRDFVVKLGSRVLALDDRLRVLWTYEIPWNEYSRCSSYIPSIGDIDGDGRDEVNGGYYLLDDDGVPRWARPVGRHMDSVAIAPWDGGRMRAICSGFGHVLTADGRVILELGEELVPHGQEVRVADFLSQSPGPEMVIRCRGHRPDAITVGSSGRVLHRLKLNESPNNTGMEAVFWHGTDAPAILFNSGWLWRADGRLAAKLPGLPPPQGRGRMDWYHCIPADVCSDRREEVVVYNPWEPCVWIFSPAPLREDAFGGYVATPRQYNVRLMD